MVYSVKVFDAGFGLPDDGSSDEEDYSDDDDDDDDDMLEGGIESYEGWFWVSAKCIYLNGHWDVDIWGSSRACNLPFVCFVLQISIVDGPSRL